MDAAQQITTLRKAGQLDEALRVAKPTLVAAPENLWLRRAVGWLFYDLIKRDVERFAEDRVSRSQLVAHLGAWLREYARGGKGDCPDLLHSLLLTQVLKVSREWPRFLAFARWWDPSFLRPEDHAPYQLDNGKTLASLEMRLIYAVGRAITSGSLEHDADLVAWGEDLVDTALETHPNDQWLHYYKSKRLMDLGRTFEARDHLLPVLRCQRQASWAWALFGRTWETNDPDKAVTCYFRAIQVARKDLEVVRTRIRLAGLLAKGERYAEAAVQVRASFQYREENAYRIPQDLSRLAASDWYKRYGDLPNVTKEPDVSEAANELLFRAEAADLVYRLGVIDNQNTGKALAHVAFDVDEGVILMYRAMPGVANLALGTCVEVGFVEGEKRPVTYRQSEQTEIPGLCDRFEGELSQRPGQNFAFVVTARGERIFVHPSLAGELQDSVSEPVCCRAVMSKDRKGKRGWRAVSVDSPIREGEQVAGIRSAHRAETRQVREV